MTLRQRIPSFGLLACAAVTFTSCAGDPLAKELKKDGFVASVPISTQMAIGDVYRRPPKPVDRPVVRMHELFSSDVEQILKTYGDPVVLPNISGGHDYTISANADLIGKVAADLQLTGARTYSITYGNPVKFMLSDYEWSGKNGALRDKIKSKWPQAPLAGNYLISGLLRVDSLQYQLKDKSGAKLNVTPGSAVEKIFKKAKLGVDWSANRDGNIAFNSPGSPKVVGFQAAQIGPDETFVQAAPGKPSAAKQNSPLRRLSRSELLKSSAGR